MSYICPVCGYPELDDPAYDEDGGGCLEICFSCGYQFGYHADDQHITHEAWRNQWINHGMIWSYGLSGRIKPSNWNPEEQLKNIGIVVGE